MIELINHLISSVKTIVSAAVKSIKAHTFSVSIDKPIQVTVPFPKTQKVEGEVTVAGQKSFEAKVALFAQLVEKKFNELGSQIKSIPNTVSVDNFPTPTEIKFPKPLPFPSSIKVENPVENVTIDNLEEVTSKLEILTNAVKEIKIEVPEEESLSSDDPKKYVPVRLTDGKEFYEAISHIVGGMKRPQTIANIDPLGTYQIADTDTASATKYYGFTDADENWYIMRETATSYRYVKGNRSYVASWTGRADLTYKYFHEEF